MEKKRFKMALWAVALLLLAALLTTLAFQTYAYLNASPQISQADLSRAFSGRISLPENAVFQGGVEKLDRWGFRASYSAYGGTYTEKQLLTEEKIGMNVEGAPCFLLEDGSFMTAPQWKELGSTDLTGFAEAAGLAYGTTILYQNGPFFLYIHLFCSDYKRTGAWLYREVVDYINEYIAEDSQQNWCDLAQTWA